MQPGRNRVLVELDRACRRLEGDRLVRASELADEVDMAFLDLVSLADAKPTPPRMRAGPQRRKPMLKTAMAPEHNTA
jgi:hypothetical protein